MTELSEKELKILDMRQYQGLSLKETLKQTGIKRKEYNEIVKKLTEAGKYNENKVREAMTERIKKNRARERYIKNKEEGKKPTDDSPYFKKCTDFLCFNYLDYRFTKKYDVSLTEKLNNLHNKNYSYETIYNTMLSSKQSFDYALEHHKFKNDFSRISYYMKIVENNLPIQVIKDKRYKEQHKGFNKKINDNDIVHQLNKKVVSKPSNKIDMSEFLD